MQYVSKIDFKGYDTLEISYVEIRNQALWSGISSKLL